MCGIAGVILPEAEQVNVVQLLAMGQALAHRGPDNMAVWLNGHCGMVHRRLSIIDLSEAGNQPFHDARYALISNGEIYNYLDMKAHLQQVGIEFTGSSDTEVLFHYLIHFGIEKTLDVIQGMYAFSFYDQKEGCTYLVRDRLGIKPLFYLVRNGGVYYASEVKALKAICSLELHDLRVFHAWESIAEMGLSYTLFKDVEQVAPGHYLEIRGSAGIQLKRYWDVLEQVDERYYQELNRLSLTEVTEQFKTLLHSSVQKMLMSDAPIGAFVSGGIDSSLVATVALAKNPHVQLFSANVIGRHSEIDDARLLAQVSHAPLHEAPFEASMFLDYWAESTYYNEAPLVRFTNAIPFAQVAKLAHQTGVKAVLTGEGSDELFLGYPSIARQRYLNVISSPIHLLRALYSLSPKLGKQLIPYPVDQKSDFALNAICGFERVETLRQAHQAYAFIPVKARHELVETIDMLKKHLVALLFRNDRMGMLASIESRFPFLDEAIIRFGVNLPVKFKIARTFDFYDIKHPFLRDKAIVREAAKNLPRQLAQKAKNGFPLYGHNNMSIQREFFRGGYLAELLGLHHAALNQLMSYHPYTIAKLASVDIFGRMYGLNQASAEVKEQIQKHIKMVI